jgi:hypothetical protein
MRKLLLGALILAAVTVWPAMVLAQNVSGIWKNDGQTMIFYQERDVIKVMCSYRGGGNIVVWYGMGIIKGNQVEYRLHHSVDSPGAFDHIHKFTVSPDGNRMDGTWGTVDTPVKGNWSLRRVGP